MAPNLSDPDLPARILVVEDDAGMRTLILRALQGGGFRVRGVSSGEEMWAALDVAPVDLIILDVMLPGVSGIELCRALRNGQGAAHPNETAPAQVPIIMVSARAEERDRVTGLEIGADDYVPKPFGQRELLARVRAVLRRGSVGTSTEKVRRETLRFAGWTLDLRRRELTDPTGATVDISGAEHDLLTSFLDNPQRVIARDRLLELSRTRLGDVSDRSIDVLVSRLRRKLGHDADTLIRTVRGLGYIFVAEVERV
ncbi:response regulator transcription factor [Gluconobacter wancherniae]|uniref:Regulatory protein VirG n=1 Tax=Gluconobacter wancherniae NBRC 103581 TaxID=656744 RepID=A0A511B2S0_9PROT|nr:response regulator transcription factor [Gluconobacter wancherniae]MBF0854883.1 response regulator transcription factor [Gluconobacter wancherniae]MBS1064026.1 response regulator transcription factor [Gluconobacter wancherniae]MBS1089454.1 response regulator transcription factor [Gluconobacter wancherniae]MBS1095574.1 response regulator transcription factor [Gluconobacter wancherniae]GBD57950.1 DNA-binding response regulator [Gluconobacter wancherniae NBRC 103581]